MCRAEAKFQDIGRTRCRAVEGGRVAQKALPVYSSKEEWRLWHSNQTFYFNFEHSDSICHGPQPVATGNQELHPPNS